MMGTPDRPDAGLGQTEEADLALLNEVPDDTGDIFHRYVRVDEMLVVEVDVVGANAPQTAFDGLPNLGRLDVDAAAVFAGLLVDVPAEFGGDDDLSRMSAKASPTISSLVHGPHISAVSKKFMPRSASPTSSNSRSTPESAWASPSAKI